MPNQNNILTPAVMLTSTS